MEILQMALAVVSPIAVLFAAADRNQSEKGSLRLRSRDAERLTSGLIERRKTGVWK